MRLPSSSCSLVAYTCLASGAQSYGGRALLVGGNCGGGGFFTAEPGKQLIAFGRDAWH